MSLSCVRDRGLQVGTFWDEADTTFDDVVLVDQDDVATGTMSKLQAHYLGQRHRAISVLISDRQNRLLLQRRAQGKYHSEGLWTNTCCSHPRPGEPVDAAAIRRLRDEMGIACTLTPLFRMRYRVRVSDRMIENEITHVFAGRFDGRPIPNPREVEEWRWVSMRQVEHEIAHHPEQYTAWFRRFHRYHWGKICAIGKSGAIASRRAVGA